MAVPFPSNSRNCEADYVEAIRDLPIMDAFTDAAESLSSISHLV